MSRKSAVSTGEVTIVRRQKLILLVALTAVPSLLMPRQAHAYLDPGSGSFLLQILIAGLLGAGVAVKAYWGKIKALFGRSSKNRPDSESDV